MTPKTADRYKLLAKEIAVNLIADGECFYITDENGLDYLEQKLCQVAEEATQKQNKKWEKYLWDEELEKRIAEQKAKDAAIVREYRWFDFDGMAGVDEIAQEMREAIAKDIEEQN